MKTIIHKKIDNGVAVQRISDKHLALVTGRGLGWNNQQIAREIEKLSIDYQTYPLMSAELCEAWVESIGRGGLTEAQAVELFQRRGREVDGYTDDAEVDYDALPYHIKGKNNDPDHLACNKGDCQDRYFRNAMVWDSTSAVRCNCDIPKAIDCHMNGIRVIRNAELVTRDTTFMRALEAGDASAQAVISTEKQTLRDIPQTFDLTTDTPEELKNKWPEGLPKE